MAASNESKGTVIIRDTSVYEIQLCYLCTTATINIWKRFIPLKIMFSFWDELSYPHSSSCMAFLWQFLSYTNILSLKTFIYCNIPNPLIFFNAFYLWRGTWLITATDHDYSAGTYSKQIPSPHNNGLYYAPPCLHTQPLGLLWMLFINAI
jgi:hypothetical protein